MKTSWLAACLVVAACGGGTPSTQGSASAAPPADTGPAQPATPRVAACSLMTRADVRALLGRPVSDGRQEDAAELSTCQYGVTIGAGAPPMVLLTVGVFSGTRPGQAQGVYDIARRNAAGVEAVAGLGDEAYWDDLLHTLRTVRGNVQIDVTIASDLGGLKMARAVAEKLLGALR